MYKIKYEDGRVVTNAWNPRGLRLVLWQQFQILQCSTGHLAGEGDAVHLQFVALIVGDARGPAAAQRHAVQPLVVRIDHGEDPVYRTISRRQLKFSYHVEKAANLLDQCLGCPRTEQHTKRGHGRTHRPTKLGDVPDGFLADAFRLAPSVTGRAQCDRVSLLRCLGLLQLGLDL
jgi:hypothetical protein